MVDIENRQTPQSALPLGLFKNALDEVTHGHTSSFFGFEFIDAAQRMATEHKPDLPPHTVRLAWKVAIARDHMLDLDPDHLQEVTEELIGDHPLIETLQLSEIQGYLNTDLGMKEVTETILQRFRQT